MTTLLEQQPDPSSNRVALVALILSIAVALVGGLRSYSDDHGAIDTRVTAVETKQDRDSQRLDRIEAKIDRLLERAR